jgi:hypothetical protein
MLFIDEEWQQRVLPAAIDSDTFSVSLSRNFRRSAG